MRLTEFLKPKEPVRSTVYGTRSVPIPMWVLESDSATYEQFLIQRKLDSMALLEAAIDRYRPMIEVFRKIDNMGLDAGLGNAWHMGATKALDWAMTVLKREDRVVWYLRFYKYNTLMKLATMPVQEVARQKEIIDFINKEFDRAKAALRKATGADDSQLWEVRGAPHQTFHTQMEHFLSMGIPQINQITWGSQMPNDLLQEFRKIESEWISRRSSVVNAENPEEITTVLEFPDGSAWFNLNKSSCSVEGSAMGHCGNTASSRSYETVLSYREPVDENGKKRDPKTTPGTHWRPRLTFVLHKGTGMLGEMKGRSNNKPKDELHPVIIALLKTDMIKGIAGGGYKPENNFEMSDLDPEVAAALIKEKPALGTISQQYALEGASESVTDRIDNILNQHEVSHNGFDKGGNHLIISIHPNYHDFTRDYGDRVAQYVAASMDEGLDSDDHYTGDLSERQELANDVFKLRPDILEHLQAYMKWTYPEQFGVKD
jgi:hypothetical protein